MHGIEAPYPNEHSCRLKPPNYKRYARKNCYQKHDEKCIDFVFGINTPNESELQSMRYKKDIWTPADARKHCEANDGTFEEASGEQALAENRWYSMETKDDEEAEISIFEEIGGSFGGGGVTVQSFKKDFDAIRSKKRIRLLLNSPGGDVFDGMAIYNILAGEREKLEVHVLGMAASMASIIALAGRELVMGRGSYLMIHNPSGLCIGDAAEMQKMADILGKIENQMAKIYAGESNLSREEALAAMAVETWYTADEAMKAGFADSVVDYGDVAARAFDLGKFGYARVPQAMRDRLSTQQAEPVTETAPEAEPAPAAAAPAVAEAAAQPAAPAETEAGTIGEVPVAPERAPDEAQAQNKALQDENEELKKANVQQAETIKNQAEKITLLQAEKDAAAKEAADLRLKKYRAEKAEAIETALKAGKIAPVNRALWEEQYDKDPEGTRKLLEAQQPVVDLTERGVATGGEEPDWTPEELAMAAKAGISKEQIDKYGPKTEAGKEK
jgi:ATP-dependent Clp endopeptidase proteolytic subunit ClpP